LGGFALALISGAGAAQITTQRDLLLAAGAAAAGYGVIQIGRFKKDLQLRFFGVSIIFGLAAGYYAPQIDIAPLRAVAQNITHTITTPALKKP
jgi:hypothetical protein